ncbi:hypothetical protein EZV62_006236 [Acer yangbiense]|uniref:Protein kinase domain-containing protein n=1 Tax=Acer yangbiense TaxID=1000413 RepID=A0A5C7IPT3_9ROSI|nr:hypothetical protein EZV62_006236 [Acer yangbiense]
MHGKGYFHCDLKPENLLVSRGLIKIGYMGSAKEINSSQPFTDYFTTRWYRAPKVILASEDYSFKVDMLAMGAIMAKLFMFKPLFPGSNMSDQMFKIFCVLDSPTAASWSWVFPELTGFDHLYQRCITLAGGLNYRFPQLLGVNLSLLMPSASGNAISLIKSLCSWDPSKRPSALEALTHPFFHSCYNINIPPSLCLRPSVGNTIGGEEFEQNNVGVIGVNHQGLIIRSCNRNRVQLG